MMEERLRAVPILMRRPDIVALKTAVDRTGKSERTIRNWCRVYGIARQTTPGAPLEISAPALEMVLHGDFKALEMLRGGDRNSLQVKRYFDHLGLPA
ncbi:hypothetical protein [Rhizobium croatiense]|uniref:hypothetical protein n=1 Tax=Rhizobium croatiense TaxID=2867516 RepID=UPI0023ED7DE1|nr:hypothetical protein [Rhizobium croatiense]WET74104.1 hypothetical protein PYR68_00760 [Rhizobium croatiense]